MRQPIESPQLREHPALSRRRSTARGARQRLLEPPAEFFRIATRLAIQPRPPARQARIDPRTLEQHAAQLRREALRKLPAQQPVADDVLVDFRLQDRKSVV